MLYNMKRFNDEARKDFATIDPQTTLGEYLLSNNYSNEFIQHYIIPIGAAIWSTVPNNMMNIPAVFFIRFFENHGLLQIVDRPAWWVIKGGSKTYVEKITSGFKDSIRLSTPVKNVKRENFSFEFTKKLIKTNKKFYVLLKKGDFDLLFLETKFAKNVFNIPNQLFSVDCCR